ncbi:MAG: metabolite traffic protein EboE [Candidatus Firestonebacteria bacterium]
MHWKKGTHLTYCLNIHPGETWKENFHSIKKYTTAVKNSISPDKPFGLGLRLSKRAATELITKIKYFKEYLREHGMYVFTINGFPYGYFHSKPVREKVYQPDWSTQKRLEYTKLLGNILIKLLPEDTTGSISTLPVTYGKILPDKAINNIIKCGEYFYQLANKTGKKIILAIESEPDCYLESTEDIIQFWKKLKLVGHKKIMEFIGICLDTCHFACNFEDPLQTITKLESLKIPVPKIQITSALRWPCSCNNKQDILLPFMDNVYLHQTRVFFDGVKLKFVDLLPAIKENPCGEWRIHFHVPLHFKSKNSTSFLLNKSFLSKATKPDRHIEIETYTFNVLPGIKENVVKSIVSEFKWLFNKGT